ncbi:Uncharacterized protein Fot_31144 [Forsythia ovata]|uniref:S-adenosylmethionine synthetase N-terminal domain-containing protein n=1 Tax=Forsythia ovata TaxID=205694 RepID=A0ABD1T498_9LAMI
MERARQRKSKGCDCGVKLVTWWQFYILDDESGCSTMRAWNKIPKVKSIVRHVQNPDMVTVIGEITTKANVDYEKIARDTCREIGYLSPEVGLDADNCKVLINIEQQSLEIAEIVHGHLTK